MQSHKVSQLGQGSLLEADHPEEGKQSLAVAVEGTLAGAGRDRQILQDMVAEGGRAGCSQCLVGTCPRLYPLGKGEAAASS